MMKRWIAILCIAALLLGNLSGCKNADGAKNPEESVAAADAPTEKTAEEGPPDINDTPVKLPQVEETEQQSLPQKNEETIQQNPPIADEETKQDPPSDKPETPIETEEEETPVPPSEEPDDNSKEGRLKKCLSTAAYNFDYMEQQGIRTFAFQVILTDYPEAVQMDEPLEPVPDFSCMEPSRVTEITIFVEFDGPYRIYKWTRRFSIVPKDYSRDSAIDSIRKLMELPYVYSVTISPGPRPDTVIED